jgi:glutamyl-tRNA reductase
VSSGAEGRRPTLLVVGLSRETAPVEVRERASLSEFAAGRLLRALRRTQAVDEALALSTCNRTEVYALVVPGEAAHAPRRIREMLSRETSISREELVQLGYDRRDGDAAEHLLGVVAGLNSTMLGEPEVVGQARAAGALAREEGTLGRVLEGLLRHAFAAGRRVRTETAIARGITSVSSVAVELARGLTGDLADRTALVIGAGEVASAVAHRLSSIGSGRLLIANRSPARAAALARQTGGRAIPLDALAEALRDADLVVCATAAASPLLTRRMLAEAGGRRAIVVLDLAVPRNVEPAAHDLPGVVLRDIDEIQRIAARNLDERRRELPRARSIVRAEVDHFQRWRDGLEAEPLLAALHRGAEEIRSRELDRALARSPEMSDAERLRLENVTRSLTTRLLHEPTERIRRATASDAGLAQLYELLSALGYRDPQPEPVISAWEPPEVATARRNGGRPRATPARSSSSFASRCA